MGMEDQSNFGLVPTTTFSSTYVGRTGNKGTRMHKHNVPLTSSHSTFRQSSISKRTI